MTDRRQHTYFATCAPGLEPILHDEIRALRFGKVERQVGGVRFSGADVDEMRANLHLRTAIRVLRRIQVFEAHEESQLYDGISAVDWDHYVRPDGSLVVQAQTKNSALDHSLYIAQITKDAICDQLSDRHGERPDVSKDDPDIALHVHLSSDRVTLSIDTSGVSLHKRGWRVFQGKAPLSETLAAAIVSLSGWDGRSPMIDPFCGSGTLLIEAALMAGGVAPGLFREKFGFERLPGHNSQRWQALRRKAKDAIQFRKKLILRGCDADGEAVEGAVENARAAGVAEHIEFGRQRAENYDYRRGWNGWIVTNPPYGERVGDERSLLPLYRQVGGRWQELCAGYRLALLSGNETLERELGLAGLSATSLFNGAIPCQLLTGEI